MADPQFKYECQTCNREFYGTSRSITMLIQRNATCTQCRGKLAFPPELTRQHQARTGSAGNGPCGQCGQVVNLAWVRCPHCRYELNPPPMPAPELTRPPAKPEPPPIPDPVIPQPASPAVTPAKAPDSAPRHASSVPPPLPPLDPAGRPELPPPLPESKANGVFGDPALTEEPSNPGVIDPSFIDEVSAPKTLPQTTSAADFENVQRVIARSTPAEAADATWFDEVGPALLTAELVAILMAVLSLHDIVGNPIIEAMLGLMFMVVLFGCARLYTLMREGQISLFSSKGMMLRILLGPVLLVVAIGASLAPLHRFMARTWPQAFTPRIMGITGAVAGVIILALQGLHDPNKSLRDTLALVTARVPAEAGYALEPGVWEGSLPLSDALGKLGEGGLGKLLDEFGLGGEGMVFQVTQIEDDLFEGTIQFEIAATQVHVRGALRHNVLVWVVDDVIYGPGHPSFPPTVPFGSLIENGEMKGIPPGPDFLLHQEGAEPEDTGSTRSAQ